MAGLSTLFNNISSLTSYIYNKDYVSANTLLNTLNTTLSTIQVAKDGIINTINSTSMSDKATLLTLVSQSIGDGLTSASTALLSAGKQIINPPLPPPFKNNFLYIFLLIAIIAIIIFIVFKV